MAVFLTLEPHQERWAHDFADEAIRIHQALGASLIAVHHIGSTSIAGIYAKPIIDILADVVSLPAIDELSHAMQALDYECMGEFGIVGRRYFRKDNKRGLSDTSDTRLLSRFTSYPTASRVPRLS